MYVTYLILYWQSFSLLEGAILDPRHLWVFERGGSSFNSTESHTGWPPSHRKRMKVKVWLKTKYLISCIARWGRPGRFIQCDIHQSFSAGCYREVKYFAKKVKVKRKWSRSLNWWPEFSQLAFATRQLQKNLVVWNAFWVKIQLLLFSIVSGWNKQTCQDHYFIYN